MTLPSETPAQLMLTQELSIEYHKRHREFWQNLDDAEKLIAILTLSAAFASLTKLIPADYANGPFIGLAALVAAILTGFSLVKNASARASKAGQLQSVWEALREEFPTEAKIESALSDYVMRKAKIKGEPDLRALRDEIYVEICRSKGLPPPPNTKTPSLVRTVFKHLF